VATLTDSVRLQVPGRTAVRPTAPVDDAMHVPLDPMPQRSFHVESPGGHLRTVVGSIAYLDKQAATYMVRASDGLLVRVPIRDIHEDAAVAPVVYR
jgi:hypothetical protein